MWGLWGFVRGLVVCAFVFVGLDASATPLFLGLGDLPGGIFASQAMDVSGDGLVVGRNHSPHT